jgi:hypothetical protein
MIPDTQLEKLYNAITDAINNEASDDEINRLIESFQVPHSREVDSIVAIIARLHTALIGVQPSPRFVRELRRDLLATYEQQLVQRIRSLPARVQIAALLVMVGGFLMLLTRRRPATKMKSAAI